MSCPYPVSCLSTDPSRARKAGLTTGTFGPLLGKQQNPSYSSQCLQHPGCSPVSTAGSERLFLDVSVPFPPGPGDHLCCLVELIPASLLVRHVLRCSKLCPGSCINKPLKISKPSISVIPPSDAPLSQCQWGVEEFPHPWRREEEILETPVQQKGGGTH